MCTRQQTIHTILASYTNLLYSLAKHATVPRQRLKRETIVSKSFELREILILSFKRKTCVHRIIIHNELIEMTWIFLHRVSDSA